MLSMVGQGTDSKATDSPATRDDEPQHLVCSCQVDATPRLALCSADCSDVPEGEPHWDDFCVVCWNMSHVAALIGCERCRDAKWGF